MDPHLLSQYGLPLAYTAVLTGVVGFLYRRQSESHAQELKREQDELKREQDRSDRLEAELRDLNETVRDRIVPALTENSRLIVDATRTLGEAAAMLTLTRRRP